MSGLPKGSVPVAIGIVVLNLAIAAVGFVAAVAVMAVAVKWVIS